MLDAREPTGFVTNFDPEDFDGQFEWTPRFARPTVSVDAAAPDIVEVANAMLASNPNGVDVLSVNDDGGERGFDLANACVFSTPRPGAYALHRARDADPNAPVQSGQARTDLPAFRIALLSRRPRTRCWPA